MSLGHHFVKDCVPQTMSHMNPPSVSCFRQVFYQSHVENSKCALPMSIMRKTQNTQDTSAQGSTAQEQRRSLPTPQLCCPYLCLGAVEPSSLQQSFPLLFGLQLQYPKMAGQPFSPSYPCCGCIPHFLQQGLFQEESTSFHLTPIAHANTYLLLVK